MSGSLSRPDRSKREVVAHWIDSDLTFASFEVKVEGVWLFGDTAVETGTLSGTSRERDTTHFFGGLRYVRVWVRDGEGCG